MKTWKKIENKQKKEKIDLKFRFWQIENPNVREEKRTGGGKAGASRGIALPEYPRLWLTDNFMVVQI